MNVIFTCGGTAGHVNPALALAGYMQKALDYEEKERICVPERNSYFSENLRLSTDASISCIRRSTLQPGNL